MKLDTANRAFLSLLAVGLGVYMLGGIGACAVLSLLAYRFAVDGVDVLREGGITLPFALAFLTVVGSGTLAGLRSLRSQLAATRKLGDNVQSRRLPAPGALAEAAGAAGVSRRRVDVIDTEERFSFAYGLLFPRVALSRGLIEAATVEELRAVLEHERYHVRNFDPLKVLVARSVPAAFFYVPALRDLRLRYVAGRELAPTGAPSRRAGARRSPVPSTRSPPDPPGRPSAPLRPSAERTSWTLASRSSRRAGSRRLRESAVPRSSCRSSGWRS